MKRILTAALVLAAAIASAPAWALDPGTYTVHCATPDTVRSDRGGYDIRMDVVDLLTLKYSFGAIISGTKVGDGRRIILTGDHGCALVETRGRARR
jgi:hypothetical protein